MGPFRGRRPGMRRMFRQMAGSPAIDAARNELIRANHLLDAGHPAEAAAIFANISSLAEQHNFPGRAAQLAARAAHAFLQAQDAQHGVASARRAMRLSITVGDWPRAVKLGQRTLAELEAHGFKDEANALRQEIEQHLTQHGLSLTQATPLEAALKLHLPAQCPSCLGPVRSDEVDWIDDTSATCSYCGSTLHAS
jgi:hypothetical protein